MPQLTAAEIYAHPEFGKVPWKGEPTKEGFVDVAKGRGGPISIAYEIHGTGPNKLVWIMGLGAFKSAWWRQIRYFGHTHSTRYSCLIFDNRGMGQSSKPITRYSTSEMAQDVLELLTTLNWMAPSSSASASSTPSATTQGQGTLQRHLNVIGVSMGGMIAQELALLIPDSIASLTLASTAPRLVNEIGFFQNLRDRVNLFVPRNADVQLADTKRRLFPAAFIEEPDIDAYVDAQGTRHGWPTNGDRFAAGELRKKQDTAGFTPKGFVLQAIAAGWHHKSDAQLRALADAVGRARICVVHGTLDGMITFTHAQLLKKGLGEGIVFKAFEGTGHMLPWEVRQDFHALVETMVDTGKAS